MKNRISMLSEETIIQIAAGEIIENPASVIKELVENSIDADSTKISIEIKNNGKDLIKITDDGYGFDKDDLKIAFKRHTTSKIKSIEELKTAISLGFRGEALSSIANVSNVTVITKKSDDILGTIAKLDHNGNIISMEEIVTNNGTTIICEDLFENIPVRKKYLDLKNYENHKTTDIINRLALSHPNVSMDYKKDGRVMLKTDRNASLINNTYSVLGREVSENLKYIEGVFEDFKVKGYISNNKLFRSNKNSQFLFVNNRSVIDRDLSKIIERQYSSIIPINRYPVFILYLDISPDLIDVNIHPKKDIIKFTNIESLETAFSKLIRDNLRSNIIISEFKQTHKEDKVNTIFNIFDENIDKKSESIENKLDNEEKVIEFTDLSIEDNIIFEDTIELESNINKFEEYEEYIEEYEEYIEDDFILQSSTPKLFENGYRYIGNLFTQYILLEDNVDKCMYVLDQHAAHERINYERLVRDYESKDIPMQNLISGYIIELTTNEFEEILALQKKLISIGIEIEEFGDNAIIIRSIPAYIEDLNPETLIRDILDNNEINTSIYDINPYELMRKACRASVKTGVHLNNLDVNQLITELRECEMPFTCPHGRPTTIKITKSELDKEFFRIQRDE